MLSVIYSERLTNCKSIHTSETSTFKLHSQSLEKLTTSSLQECIIHSPTFFSKISPHKNITVQACLNFEILNRLKFIYFNRTNHLRFFSPSLTTQYFLALSIYLISSSQELSLIYRRSIFFWGQIMASNSLQLQISQFFPIWYKLKSAL